MLFRRYDIALSWGYNLIHGKHTPITEFLHDGQDGLDVFGVLTVVCQLSGVRLCPGVTVTLPPTSWGMCMPHPVVAMAAGLKFDEIVGDPDHLECIAAGGEVWDIAQMNDHGVPHDEIGRWVYRNLLPRLQCERDVVSYHGGEC